MKTVVSCLTPLAVLAFFLCGPAAAENQPSEQAGDSCEVVGINYQDNPELTRSEKLALMEQAFYESLKQFEDCNLSSRSSSSSSGNDTSGGDAGGQSAASETLQGTEAETEQGSVMPGSDVTAEISGEETTEQVTAGPSDNGKIPDDIPSADNDDAIAAQIRLAAEAETDPEIREKLWNEYRKYKGMKVEH